MDAFSKSMFSLRFDGADMRAPPLRDTSAKREIVARQLEKNRKYASGSEQSASEPASAAEQSSPEKESSEAALNTSMSAQLHQGLRNVYESVETLEVRSISNAFFVSPNATLNHDCLAFALYLT
jgi:hypothetical protein